MIRYKIDVMEALKNVGFNSTLARYTKIFSQSTMTKFKNGDANISLENLNRLCTVLRMQPNEIIDYVVTDNDSKYLIECIKKTTVETTEEQVDYIVADGDNNLLVEKTTKK